MTGNRDALKSAVKAYILEEFLPGEDPASLTDDTPLISGGILDSIATIKLISFLEEEFGVAFEAHEVSVDYLDTLERIAGIVESKA